MLPGNPSNLVVGVLSVKKTLHLSRDLKFCMVVDLVHVNEILPGVKSVDPGLQHNKPFLHPLQNFEKMKLLRYGHVIIHLKVFFIVELIYDNSNNNSLS